jgi:hypothetical protein
MEVAKLPYITCVGHRIAKNNPPQWTTFQPSEKPWPRHIGSMPVLDRSRMPWT